MKEQNRVMTAIVGSYPKPAFLFPGSGRDLLNQMGMTLYGLEKEVGQQEFQERLDRAALMAIEDQNAAGIDYITDGEERRGHYVLYLLRKLAGIDFEHLTEKPIRDGRYTRKLPTVTEKITYRGPILVDDFAFTQQHAKGIPKIGLPGPSTVVDSVADEHYQGDREGMAMDYARAIHHEVRNLIEAGCRAIQFDDPVLLRYPTQAQTWGMRALQACFEGLESRAESVGSLVARGEDALQYLPKEQLILAPDCGMLQLSRSAARGKLVNLARAARELSGEEEIWA